jgi:hypothetical protein
MIQIIARGLFSGALIVAFALTSPAGAIDKSGTQKVAPVTAKKMGPANMTKDDCSGLGGKIVDVVGVCMSGQVCITTGENKKDHLVCITKQ